MNSTLAFLSLRRMLLTCWQSQEVKWQEDAETAGAPALTGSPDTQVSAKHAVQHRDGTCLL